ncbi:MAG: hypothetical protein ACI841_000519, partial [Planctomycetota bacterium]
AARDRTIKRVKRLGRRKWKKVSGYHCQGTVENTFFRYIAPGEAWRKGMMRI